MKPQLCEEQKCCECRLDIAWKLVIPSTTTKCPKSQIYFFGTLENGSKKCFRTSAVAKILILNFSKKQQKIVSLLREYAHIYGTEKRENWQCLCGSYSENRIRKSVGQKEFFSRIIKYSLLLALFCTQKFFGNIFYVESVLLLCEKQQKQNCYLWKQKNYAP